MDDDSVREAPGVAHGVVLLVSCISACTPSGCCRSRGRRFDSATVVGGGRSWSCGESCPWSRRWRSCAARPRRLLGALGLARQRTARGAGLVLLRRTPMAIAALFADFRGARPRSRRSAMPCWARSPRSCSFADFCSDCCGRSPAGAVSTAIVFERAWVFGLAHDGDARAVRGPGGGRRGHGLDRSTAGAACGPRIALHGAMNLWWDLARTRSPAGADVVRCPCRPHRSPRLFLRWQLRRVRTGRMGRWY